jgi:hypothetical protein
VASSGTQGQKDGALFPDRDDSRARAGNSRFVHRTPDFTRRAVSRASRFCGPRSGLLKIPFFAVAARSGAGLRGMALSPVRNSRYSAVI